MQRALQLGIIMTPGQRWVKGQSDHLHFRFKSLLSVMTVSENVAVIMYHYSCWLRVIMSSLHIVTSDITSLLHINIIVNDYDYI